MHYFKVDPAELNRTADLIGQARSELFGSWGDVPMSTVTSNLNTPRVQHAFDDFWGHWSDGLTIIGTQLDDAEKHLRAAAEEYSSADACVQDAVTPETRT